MIYQIPNPTENTITYVCPDQETIDEGKTLGYEGDFIIGTQVDAENILSQIRHFWINVNSELFSVNKDIDPDPIQVTWIACNLADEPQNTNVDYNVFNVINGRYTLVIGLDSAKDLLDRTKVETSEYFVQISSLEKWEPPREGPSIGVQTF
jgi:hypothetical protein